MRQCKILINSNTTPVSRNSGELNEKLCANSRCYRKDESQPMSNFKQTQFGYDFYCIQCRDGTAPQLTRICVREDCCHGINSQSIDNFKVLPRTGNHSTVCKDCDRTKRNKPKKSKPKKREHKKFSISQDDIEIIRHYRYNCSMSAIKVVQQTGFSKSTIDRYAPYYAKGMIAPHKFSIVVGGKYKSLSDNRIVTVIGFVSVWDREQWNKVLYKYDDEIDSNYLECYNAEFQNHFRSISKDDQNVNYH